MLDVFVLVDTIVFDEAIMLRERERERERREREREREREKREERDNKQTNTDNRPPHGQSRKPKCKHKFWTLINTR